MTYFTPVTHMNTLKYLISLNQTEDCESVIRIGEEIFQKSIENLPDMKIADMLFKNPSNSHELNQFLIYREQAAVACAIQEHLDLEEDLLAFPKVFNGVCGGRSGLDNKTCCAIQRLFLSSIDFWFPLR